MALAFLQGHRQLQLATGDPGQQGVALLVVTQLLQQAGGINLRVQEGFQAQVAAQLGHDQQIVHATTTIAAIGLGNRYRAQAEITELLPERPAEAQLAAVELLALFEAVAVAGQTDHGVLQHLLLFAECEVHARASPRVRESSWR
ncbi:hypothetical protein D3C85_977050 [compost metagenome]